MPALDAIAAIAAIEAPRDRARVADARVLAKLLHYSAGITRTLRFNGGAMEFRAAACTGALYHIELYIVCGDLPGLEAGVYQVGVHDASLRRLRAGDYRAALIEATAGEQAVADAAAVIVYTTTFWRNAWKYQSRAYRHAFWDSGTILANTLAVAASEGLPVRVVTGFVDTSVNRLIDVDTNHEAAVALVPVGYDPGQRPSSVSAFEPLGLETVPLSYHEIDYPLIRRMHQASSLESSEEVSDWRGARPGAAPEGKPAPAVMAGVMEPEDGSIETVIRRRGSSRRFSATPISAEALTTVLETATHGIPGDYLDRPSDSLAEPYLIVNRVDGVAPGAYRYDRGRRELELLRSGSFIEEAGYLDLGQALGADAAVDVYFLADLDTVVGSLGNRGYRAAQLDAAITAGKMYLAAYALELGATGLTFFDDDVIEFFSPRARGLSVMFLLALGVPARRRAGAPNQMERGRGRPRGAPQCHVGGCGGRRRAYEGARGSGWRG